MTTKLYRVTVPQHVLGSASVGNVVARPDRDPFVVLVAGAITEDEAMATGVTLDELRGRSFIKIVQNRAYKKTV